MTSWVVKWSPRDGAKALFGAASYVYVRQYRCAPWGKALNFAA
jgi:hypothetical protein